MIGYAVDTSNDGGFSGKKRVAVFPLLHALLVGFLEDNGVERVGGGGLEEGVAGEDGTHLVEFVDGERVEGVAGDVGVVAEAARGERGSLDESGNFELKEAIVGGAPSRVEVAV